MTAPGSKPRPRKLRGDYDPRFGLSRRAVSPVFTRRFDAAAPPLAPSLATGGHRGPQALVVYAPSLGWCGRLLARAGATGTVVGTRPVSAKAVMCVTVGATAGMMLAQLFDSVTILAPFYGLLAGGAGAGAGWLAVRGRGSITIWVEQWQPRLDTIRRLLRNADQIGQPLLSPPALRSALHTSLWHAANSVGEPAEAQVMHALDQQLELLEQYSEAALVELESPLIEARKTAVTGRLAAAVQEMAALLATGTGSRHQGAGEPAVDRARVPNDGG